jgi:Phospholipase B
MPARWIGVVVIFLAGAAALSQTQPAALSSRTGDPAGKASARAELRPGLSDQQRATLAKAHRHEKHGWVYLHIEGEPRERGFQHGYLLSREIAEAVRARRGLWAYESGMDWKWLVEKSAALFAGKIDPECLAEIDGIADGLQAAGVPSSRDELVAYNAYFELAWYWWPREKKSLGAAAVPPVKQSCSSFIATGKMTADGNVVLGHNSMVDFPEADFNLILDIAPARGRRLLMQSAPGCIHSGTDFFVTSAGLVGSETTIGGFDGFDPKGLPEFVRMRRATQDAGSIEDWCAIMKKGNNGGYANAWLLGDVRTGDIARLELGLKYVGFEKKRDGYFVGCNVAEDPKILRFETNTKDTDIRLSSVARRVRWKQLMQKYAGKIDLELAKQFEADHWDCYLGQEHAGGRSLCGHFERDRLAWGEWPGAPFYPAGTFDGKALDAKLAKEMSFAARWGSACGAAFSAQEFLAAHPQFECLKDLLKDRPSQPWAVFRAGEAP